MTASLSSAWTDVFRAVVDRSHLITGDELSSMVDAAVRAVDLTAEVYLVDLGQRLLTPVRPGGAQRLMVETSDAGPSSRPGPWPPRRS